MSSIDGHNEIEFTNLPPGLDRPGTPVTILGGTEADPAAQAVIDREQGRRLDLADVRARLAGKEGPAYWSSLEELSESPEFGELMEREFPEMASRIDAVDRRGFLKLMGASMAMAGLTACTRQPAEKIIPYVKPPEEIIPGRPLFYATSMTLGGYAMGLLAESHMGRPTKLEGNPGHPASLGSTNALAQASILSLYDPDRSQFVKHRGRLGTWERFLRELEEQLGLQDAKKGAGLRILTETVTSPTLVRQIEQLLEKYPSAKWHQYDAVSRDNTWEGAKQAFGEYVDTLYHFDKADVVLALDADFLGQGPAHVRYARDFTSRRDMSVEGTDLNRLYVAESVPSMTGSMADHRLPVRSSDIERFVRALARELGIQAPGEDVPAGQQAFLQAVASDLRGNKGASVLVVGERQSPVVHALAHAINHELGAPGKTVTHVLPSDPRPGSRQASLDDLIEDMKLRWVDVLVVLDANPVYNAPADTQFLKYFSDVPFRVHLGMYDDETANLSHWHIPQSHFLEGWSDAMAYDGTANIVQPLIEPLYSSRTAHQLLAALLGEGDRQADTIIRDYWKGEGLEDDAVWRRALHDGVIPGSGPIPRRVRARRDFPASDNATSDLEIVFTADEATVDGRYANNGWLQEMPRSVTKLTWDNAVMLSPATAEQLGVTTHDVVEVELEGRFVRGAVWVTPGQADGSIGVQLGYGRRRAGTVGNQVGFDAYSIRRSSSPWIDRDISVTRTGERHRLVNTQSHHRMERRKLVRVATLDAFKNHPDFASHIEPHAPPTESMYPLYDYSKGYQWGMTINLNNCIGCNACLVACQAENNIPVVGKEGVSHGREMHWIRLDRYYEGGLDNPDTHFQPVPCMHCDKAPCEPVCPVGATMQSAEGLNQMVYNRCVGTRYCSNNCPYKVRRFNFGQYTDLKTPVKKLLRNPDVTVRVRGVMEKCTYCVQRINVARIDAEKQGRRIADGEVKTACQQACPTRAISFGDMNDSNSEIAKKKASVLNYALLGDLNTRPKTTYLAKIKNPNPDLTGVEKA